MAFTDVNHADGKIDRPVITSYDSGYEHSLEHLIFVRHLVDQAIEDVEEPAIEHEMPAIAV